MDAVFNEKFNGVENEIFKVVFYPDRVYHARYLNATRSPRYRYNVREVRSAIGVLVMKGQVYLDDVFLTNFVRIEYKPHRLIELVRETNRLLDNVIMGWSKFIPEAEQQESDQAPAESVFKLEFCQWIRAYQVEIWETLEAPTGTHHDYKVLDMIGKDGSITRIPEFSKILGKSSDTLKALKKIELAFRENDVDLPIGYQINNPQWDNNFQRSFQQPNIDQPSANENTVNVGNYLIDFQRGYYVQSDDVSPVRYLNAMMNEDNPDRQAENIIEMKWILQREFGSSVVFFHEVLIPPGKVEGTHRHIGTEELYYIVEGDGVAYMGESDDPKLSHLPTKTIDVFGFGATPCKELAVKPGDVIFTKSGGVHGIRNNSNKPLRFVAFLYHTQ